MDGHYHQMNITLVQFTRPLVHSQNCLHRFCVYHLIMFNVCIPQFLTDDPSIEQHDKDLDICKYEGQRNLWYATKF